MKYGNPAITKIINDTKKISLKRRLVIIFILLICFLAGLAFPSLMQKQIRNPSKQLSQINKADNAVLEISSNKSRLKEGETFTVTILINSSGRGVEAADFVLNYDSNYLNLVSASPGSFFTVYPVSKIEKDNFRLSGIAKRVENSFVVPKGKGTIATLLFKAVKPVNSTIIVFNESKTIVASEGENILGQTNRLKIKIEKKS